jgi:hypothetical protein
VLLNVSCGACRALLPDIERWQSEDGNRLTVVMISKGPVDWVKARLAGHTLRDVLIQPKREIRSAYRLSSSPSAIVIHLDGSIGSLPAAGPDAVRKLIEAWVRGREDAGTAGLSPNR